MKVGDKLIFKPPKLGNDELTHKFYSRRGKYILDSFIKYQKYSIYKIDGEFIVIEDKDLELWVFKDDKNSRWNYRLFFCTNQELRIEKLKQLCPKDTIVKNHV